MNVKIEIKAGKVLAGVKVLVTDMPKVLKRDSKRALEWARERITAFFPNGSRGGYTTPWTPKQAKGERGAYKRTGTYGSGWRIQSISGKNAFRLISTTWYSHYVGGNAYGRGQAAVHRGRWPVAFDVVQTAYDTVLRQYLAVSLRDVIRKAGFGGGEAGGL